MSDTGLGRRGGPVAGSVEPWSLHQPRRRGVLQDAADTGAGDQASQRDEKNWPCNRGHDA